MKWILAAPYLQKLEKGLWTSMMDLDPSLDITVSPSHYLHNRSRVRAGINDWKDYWEHSADIWKKSQQTDGGIITAFPQLAVCVGLRKRLSNKSTPIIAGTFNLGALHGNIKRVLANQALRSINKFIVHSSEEINHYSHYLNLPASKFEFVPLHKPIMPATAHEDLEHPFILSMGSANRDYKTLFKAIRITGHPLIVVAPPHALSGLDIPSSVTIKSNLSLLECRVLAQQARINIVPISNEHTASGQVTAIEAMMYGKAVIATDTIGTRDYIQHEKTGFLTKSHSVTELSQSIDDLWHDAMLRQKLSINAYNYVKTELSHQKTASRLLHILNSI